MSNHLAIATVTAVLQKKLQAAVQRDVDGARVMVSRPNSVEGGVLEIGVNLYLYQVVPNHVWHTTSEIQGRQRRGMMARRSRMGLDLHYMISFYGNDGEHEPQRLLGSTIRTLSDLNQLDKQAIQDTITDATFSYLADSDLALQVQEISVQPLELNMDELSKIWSIFFQTPYALSVAYKATVIIIEGEDLMDRALPVREVPSFATVPFPVQPQVDEAIAKAGRFQPILANSVLSVLGKQLLGPQTLIRIGEYELVPTKLEPGLLEFCLSHLDVSQLRAGIQTLTVVHRQAIGDGVRGGDGTRGGDATRGGSMTSMQRGGSPAPSSSIGQVSAVLDTPEFQTLVESNAVPFVLRPQIVGQQLENIFDHGDGNKDAELTLTTDVTIYPDQMVVLSLNEWSVSAPLSYQIEATPHTSPTNTITFPLRDIKDAQYLMRLQIDGAASPLDRDLDPDSSTFQWFIRPRLTV